MDAKQILTTIFAILVWILIAWHSYVLYNSKEAQTRAVQRSDTGLDESCLADMESKVIHGRLIFPVASWMAFLSTAMFNLAYLSIAFTPNATVQSCTTALRFGASAMALHKAGLYLYLFVRGRLTIHVSSPLYYRLLLVYGILSLLAMLVLIVITPVSLTNGKCVAVEAGPSRTTFAVLLISMDLLLTSSLGVMFFQPILAWFRSTESSGDDNNQKQEKVVVQLAVLSVAALLATLVSMPLAVVWLEFDFVPIQIDHLINCTVIIQQYRMFSKGQTMEMIMTMSSQSKDGRSAASKMAGVALTK